MFVYVCEYLLKFAGFPSQMRDRSLRLRFYDFVQGSKELVEGDLQLSFQNSKPSVVHSRISSRMKLKPLSPNP